MALLSNHPSLALILIIKKLYLSLLLVSQLYLYPLWSGFLFTDLLQRWVCNALSIALKSKYSEYLVFSSLIRQQNLTGPDLRLITDIIHLVWYNYLYFLL